MVGTFDLLLFRRDESLGRCLMAATKLAKESLNQAVPAAGDHVDGSGGDPAEVVRLMEQDEHCRKFLDRYSGHSHFLVLFILLLQSL